MPGPAWSRSPLSRLLFLSALVALALVAGGRSGEDPPARVAVLQELRLTDIRYLPRELRELAGQRATVLVFTTTTCPIVARYLPRLAELSTTYTDRGVRFAAVNVGPDDSVQDMALQALGQKITFPFVKDETGGAASAFGVTRTPEVVVLDEHMKVRYRGRIDSQYRLGGTRPDPGRRDLVEALEDVLAGRNVRVPQTPVDGCAITPRRAPLLKSQLTWARDVAPVIARHCIECHRTGGEAPFPLTTYEHAAGKAAMIAEVVRQGRMPPWFAHPDFGQFENERRLTDNERDTILTWASADAPPGDLDGAPPPHIFAESTWTIGEPDLVIRALVPENLPADGYIPYRYIIFPYVFTHDTWVQGIEILPSNPRVVHHANLGFATLGEGFDANRNFLTGRVPGGRAVDLSDGQAFLIPAGSILGVQVHYVTTGREETDRISVGLRFAKEPVRKQVHYLRLANTRFAIPPGDPAHEARSVRALSGDATLVGLFMHMHLRGRDATFLAHLPEGKTRTLLVLPNYSFDWQIGYQYTPGAMRLPKGTRLEAIVHFDNSPFNPFNPDPTATVRYGPQTHDEMMDGFVFFTLDEEDLNLEIDPGTGRARPPRGEVRDPPVD